MKNYKERTLKKKRQKGREIWREEHPIQYVLNYAVLYQDVEDARPKTNNAVCLMGSHSVCLCRNILF